MKLRKIEKGLIKSKIEFIRGNLISKQLKKTLNQDFLGLSPKNQGNHILNFLLSWESQDKQFLQNISKGIIVKTHWNSSRKARVFGHDNPLRPSLNGLSNVGAYPSKPLEVIH